MLTNIVILLFATAAFAFNVRITPEELKEFVQEIDVTIKANEHEAQIEIRANVIPLFNFTADAKASIYGNFTELAKPYWDEIASIEKESAGQNISACIELGNKQLYSLNVTTAEPLVQEVNLYLDRGNQTLFDSSAAAYGPIEELIALEEKVNECAENECAADLKNEAIDLFAKALNVTNSAISAAHDYVLVDLPAYLAKVAIDGDAYAQTYTTYLTDVKNCINYL